MMDHPLMMPAGRIWESGIPGRNLTPAVQRVALLYQWFRTIPVIESEGHIVCR